MPVAVERVDLGPGPLVGALYPRGAMARTFDDEPEPRATTPPPGDDPVRTTETDALADGIDRALGVADRVRDIGYAAAQAGVSVDLIRQLRRAMGLPELEDDEPAFADSDVDMIRSIASVIDSQVATVDEVLAIARLIGTSMAHIAEAQIDAFVGSGLWSKVMDQTIATDAAAHADGAESSSAPIEVDSALLESVVGALAPPLERSLIFVWRRHLSATSRRLLASLSSGDASAAIGFCDVVGYTERTRAMSPLEVDTLLKEFDELSYETVSLGGGRVIKMIGDEVMFEAPTIVEAARIALALIEAAAVSPHVGETRAAVASGPVISRAGDRFGAPVNLAARLTAAAFPGSVLIPASALAELAGVADLVAKPLRTPLRLKGIGAVRAMVIRPVNSR